MDALKKYGDGQSALSWQRLDGALEMLRSSGALHGGGQHPRRPWAIAVVALVDPDLIGGSLSQLLKCLTAAKISEELARRAVASMAVCWIRSSSDRRHPTGRTLKLLDPGRKLHKFVERAPGSPAASPENVHLYEGRERLIAQVEELGAGRFDAQALALLQTTGASEDSGPARIFEVLLQEWEGIVVDACAPGFRETLEKSCKQPQSVAVESGLAVSAGSSPSFPSEGIGDYHLQSLLFPQPLFVIDAWEFPSFIRAKPLMEERCGRSPLCWPAVSATIVDKDSRRTLRKYKLGLEDLFADGPGLLERLGEKISVDLAGQKFGGLELQIRESLDELEEAAEENGSFARAREECRRRILFQLQKMRGRFEAAALGKRETMQRRVSRLYASLIPEGNLQERGLSLVHFLLNSGMDLPTILYENMDIETFEHQTLDSY